MKKYRAWFEFAEKTRQSENTAKEFKEYEKDDVFSEIIRKLRAEKLHKDEYDYIRLYNYYVETNEKTKRESREEGREEGREEERQNAYQKTLEKAKLMKQKGLALEDIHQFTDIPMEVIRGL